MNNINFVWIGFQLGVGLLLAFSVVMGIALFLKITFSPNDHDDSDSRMARSGLVVLTDHKTGLQYLKANGSLTPRIGANGEHLKEQAND